MEEAGAALNNVISIVWAREDVLKNLAVITSVLGNSKHRRIQFFADIPLEAKKNETENCALCLFHFNVHRL